MHVKHIFVVKADNVENAVKKVESDLELDESLTSDNYWSVVGALDVKKNEYTFYDTSREDERLRTVEGINSVVGKFIDPAIYQGMKEQLALDTVRENWESVERLAKGLDGIKDALGKGFDITADPLVEVNGWDKLMFGVTDWTTIDDDTASPRFAVIVDFHF